MAGVDGNWIHNLNQIYAGMDSKSYIYWRDALANRERNYRNETNNSSV